MVFNRKPDPQPPVEQPPSLRRPGAAAAHLHAVGGTALQQSVIGNDLSIEGEGITIRCKGTLKVLGSIHADVHCHEVEVGKDAEVSGAVAADTVNVFGHVKGAILGTHVVLHASAVVDGDIHSHLLSIEQGAVFDGRSRRVADPSELAPQLDRPGQVAEARHEPPPVRSIHLPPNTPFAS